MLKSGFKPGRSVLGDVPWDAANHAEHQVRTTKVL
jgi:hypothetical protein